MSGGDSQAGANVWDTYPRPLHGLGLLRTWHSAGSVWRAIIPRDRGGSCQASADLSPQKSCNLTSFEFIGFNPVAKASSDSRAGKSDPVSGWGVAGSHFRGACGVDNIFTISFGKYNLLPSPCCYLHICSLYYDIFLFEC